jgi:hypothetical protein
VQAAGKAAGAAVAKTGGRAAAAGAIAAKVVKTISGSSPGDVASAAGAAASHVVQKQGGNATSGTELIYAVADARDAW